MQESELQTIIDCRTLFDREKTEKRTGEKTSCPICWDDWSFDRTYLRRETYLQKLQWHHRNRNSDIDQRKNSGLGSRWWQRMGHQIWTQSGVSICLTHKYFRFVSKILNLKELFLCRCSLSQWKRTWVAVACLASLPSTTADLQHKKHFTIWRNFKETDLRHREAKHLEKTTEPSGCFQ